MGERHAIRSVRRTALLIVVMCLGAASGHDFEELDELLFHGPDVQRIDCPEPHVRWLRDNVLAGACATTAEPFVAVAARLREHLNGAFGAHVEAVRPWRYRLSEDLFERTFRHRDGPYMAVRFVPGDEGGPHGLLMLVMTL